MNLTQGQELAVEMVRRNQLRSTVCVIAGHAGVGKTSLIKILSSSVGIPLVLTPTGKAAVRVTEATGLDACTVHRWLYKPVEVNGGLKFVRRQMIDIIPPKSKLVVIDEASMVNSKMWADVRDVCKFHGLTVVLVGDPLPAQRRRPALP